MPGDPARNPPPMNTDDFRRAAHEAVDFIADYWSRLQRAPGEEGAIPVRREIAPGTVAAKLPARAPERPERFDDVMRDVRELIVPNLTHWQHPGFMAYFPANASAPAVIGELLSAGLGVNGMLWATSPAATELETRVLDWMAHACGLPECFLSAAPPLWGETTPSGGGVIQGTASEATLVALLAARHRARPVLAARPLMMYATDQAHSSVIKAAMIAGLADGPGDTRHVTMIRTNPDHSMDAAALRARIEGDLQRGVAPFFVAATLGTTGSMARDNIRAIGNAITNATSSAGTGTYSAPRVWLHVDAAMAGAAWVCPEHRGMLDGIERASSVAFNPHKWLLTNFDCGLFWTRDRASVTGALSITPEYLRTNASDVIDYRDWQVPLGRRFRALKLWMVLRHYGLEGLRSHIRATLEMTALAERLIRGDRHFEIAAPREAASPLVVFRLRGICDTPAHAEALNAKNKLLLDRVNASGTCLLSHTTLRDHARPDLPPRFVLRMALGGTFTTPAHVEGAWRVIAGSA